MRPTSSPRPISIATPGSTPIPAFWRPGCVGEIQAEGMRTAPHDRKKFLQVLDEIRGLSIQPAAIMQDRMIELAASAGVA